LTSFVGSFSTAEVSEDCLDTFFHVAMLPSFEFRDDIGDPPSSDSESLSDLSSRRMGQLSRQVDRGNLRRPTPAITQVRDWNIPAARDRCFDVVQARRARRALSDGDFFVAGPVLDKVLHASHEVVAPHEELISHRPGSGLTSKACIDELDERTTTLA
jgi:hypothetical protein